MKKEIWLNYLESQVERCRQEGEALSQDCREDEARRSRRLRNFIRERRTALDIRGSTHYNTTL